MRALGVAVTSLLISVILAGCASFFELGENPFAPESDSGRLVPKTPLVAGNTFVTGGDEPFRLNVSYDYVHVASKRYRAGPHQATAWLFVDRLSDEPDAFLEIHRIDGATVKEFGAGKPTTINRFKMLAQDYCIALNGPEIPKPVAVYISMFLEAGYEVSDYLLVRRFTFAEPAETAPFRIDIVYLEDIVRSGYSCVELGDLDNPDSKEIETFLTAFRLRAQRTFAIND